MDPLTFPTSVSYSCFKRSIDDPVGGLRAMAVADETQKRLLEAAGQVFAEKGFQEATVRKICERAGANIAAINYHFGDKEQLYEAALRHAFQCRLDQMPVPAWPPGTPAVQKLRDVIYAITERMVDDRYLPWQWQL